MEIWKDIQGYNGVYQISNCGRVRRIWKKSRRKPEGELKILSCSFDSDGYVMSHLYKKKVKRIRIHRLVAIEFIGNPLNKPQVNHIDGNKANNHVANLEWCTAIENSKHAWDTGLIKAKRGEEHGGSKLTQNQVDQIRELKGLKTQKEIAKIFNVSTTAISRIHTGKAWKKLKTV